MSSNKSIHVVWVLANCSNAPYFNWFAEQACKNPEIKMSFVCLYPTKPQMIDDMKKYGYECYWVKYDSRYRKSQFIAGIFKLHKLFKKIKPDIVHSHLFDDSVMALTAAKLAGIKTRFITKGDTGFHYFYAPKWAIFDKLNNKLASHIIALSSESKKFILEKENAKPEKVHLIHHGIPIDKATEQNDAYKAEFIKKWNLANRKVIGTIARLIEWKGYTHIINAAEKLIPEYPDLLFLFVGKGPQKEELEALVHSKNLNHTIKYIDWVEADHLPSLYGLMNIYVHAANYEPFGLVIAEALANAAPVVSTKTGAALDAIDHLKSGYLCEPNSDDIANGIRFILKNNINNTIGLAGKKAADALYSIEVMYAKHIQLYKQALGTI